MGPILDKRVRETFQGIKKWSAPNGHDMNTALIRHAKDRLLARIGTSQHAEDVVLKGGLLMGALLLDIARPTKDIDLVFVEDADERRVMDVLRDAAAQPSVDPWIYDLENAKVERLAGEEWHAIRVRFEARLGATRTPMCIDATSGMVVRPAARFMELPPLVPGDSPARVLAYTPALALAEKAHACAMVGPRNTRSKDWLDAWACAQRLEIDGEDLAEAIAAVFEHRGDAIPDVEECLTWAEPMAEFLSDRWKNWIAREKPRSNPPDDIRVIMAEIREFLAPAMAAAKAGEGHRLGRWTPGQGWGQSLALTP